MAAAQEQAHVMFPDGGEAQQRLHIQPVFIRRQTSHTQQQQAPSSPSPQAADFSVLLRSVAALCSPGGGGLEAGSGMAPLGDSSSNNTLHHQDLAVFRSSPQVHSSPSLLYSPMATSNGGSFATSSTMNARAGTPDMLSPDGGAFGSAAAAAAAAAACNDPQMALLGSSGSSFAQNLSAAAAAAAMFGDGVQTLYPSNDQTQMAAMAAAAAAAGATRAAHHTQALLQQQAAAAANLSSTIGSFGSLSSLTSPLGAGGLGKLEESLSGGLFAPGSLAKPVSSSLYIKNLPPDADKLFLYEKFSPYGAILSVKVLNDPTSGHCRGVGFVNFAEHGSAVRSIQALHGTKVGDKLMHVSLQTPRIRASAVQC